MISTMMRRDLDFRDFDPLIADLNRLRDEGYERVGNWSLSQACDHLAIFIRGSMDGFDRMLPWIVRATVGRLLLRWVLNSRKMKAGLKVPKDFLPQSPREDDQAVASLVELIERFRNHKGPCRPSPLFGNLSHQQWSQLHLIHAAHHLSFLVPGADSA